MEAHTAHYRMPYLKFERLPVIHIPRRYHEVEQLALLVADKVQHKPEEPTHGTLAPLGDTLEDLVHVDSLVPAHPERCAVNYTDARTLAKQHFLEKQANYIAMSHPSSTNRLYEAI